MFKPINGWTKRKILNVLKKRRYNRASVDADGTCMYRAPNGNRCAVGMFIPKGHESEEIFNSYYRLIKMYPDLQENMPLNHAGMDALQAVHDGGLDEAINLDAKQDMIAWVKANVEG